MRVGSVVVAVCALLVATAVVTTASSPLDEAQQEMAQAIDDAVKHTQRFETATKQKASDFWSNFPPPRELKEKLQDPSLLEALISSLSAHPLTPESESLSKLRETAKELAATYYADILDDLNALQAATKKYLHAKNIARDKKRLDKYGVITSSHVLDVGYELEDPNVMLKQDGHTHIKKGLVVAKSRDPLVSVTADTVVLGPRDYYADLEIITKPSNMPNYVLKRGLVALNGVLSGDLDLLHQYHFSLRPKEDFKPLEVQINLLVDLQGWSALALHYLSKRAEVKKAFFSAKEMEAFKQLPVEDQFVVYYMAALRTLRRTSLQRDPQRQEEIKSLKKKKTLSDFETTRLQYTFDDVANQGRGGSIKNAFGLQLKAKFTTVMKVYGLQWKEKLFLGPPLKSWWTKEEYDLCKEVLEAGQESAVHIMKQDKYFLVEYRTGGDFVDVALEVGSEGQKPTHTVRRDTLLEFINGIGKDSQK